MLILLSLSPDTLTINSNTPLVLDKNILYWVLLPIFIVMFLQGILRQYISVLLRDDKQVGTNLSLINANEQLDNIQRNSMLARSRRLRINGNYIPYNSVIIRQKYYSSTAFNDALIGQKGSNNSDSNDTSTSSNPGQDPTAMMGMMKQNLSNMLPNMILMGWVSYFFSGFVCVQLPFRLGNRLKPMLQRGLTLTNLDSTYVSSISWYFILLFGLKGLFTLVLGDNATAINTTHEIQMMQQMTNSMPGQPSIDYKKLFTQEANELDMMNINYEIPDCEYRILQSAIKQ